MELQIKQEIDAPADRVWQILGQQFAAIGNWSTTVETSRALDANEVPAGLPIAPQAPVPGRATPNLLGELKEILTRYSDAEMSFTFEVDGLPPIIRYSQNSTRVQDLGPDRCLVTFDLQMVPKGIFKVMNPVLRRRLSTSQRGPAGLMRELKIYAETGKTAA